MKAGIIGAGSESLHTIEMAHKHGLSVCAFDGDKNALGLSVADKGIVQDIRNVSETVHLISSEKIDFLLVAPIGYILTTVGAVNDALELPGISEKAAKICTDKYLFHQELSKEGLRKCDCHLLEGKGSKEEIWNLVIKEVRNMSFPVILKPRFGSGSRGIHFISEMEEIEKLKEQVLNEKTEGTGVFGDYEDYILEECISGEEYGVDGAVTKEGFEMVLLRKKDNTPLPDRQAVAYYSVDSTEDSYQIICPYITAIVQSLDLKECLLHADVILSANGPFVIEMSARPSGHNLHNLFTPLATGIDMAEQYILYRMGKEYSFKPVYTKKLMIHYFDMVGKVCRILSAKEIEQLTGRKVLAYECTLKVGDVLEPVSNGHGLMGRGYYVLEGETSDELRDLSCLVSEAFLQ